MLIAAAKRESEQGRRGHAELDARPEIRAGGLVSYHNTRDRGNHRDALSVRSSAVKACVGMRSREELLREVNGRLVFLDDRNHVRGVKGVTQSLFALGWSHLDRDRVCLQR